MACSGTYYFCWLLTSEQLRFLLPLLAPLAVALAAAAAGLFSVRARAAQYLWLASCLPGLLVITAWFAEQNPVSVVLGGESRAAYLERRLDYYPYYETINRTLPPNARVWLVNLRNDGYHLERPFVADYVFEDYTLAQLVREAKSLAELRARVQALGVTHLLVRHDVLLDYARSSVVDDRLPVAANQARLDLLKSFLSDGNAVIKGDAKFTLLKM
ncbi:MAG: hypothetical protein JO166_17820 [Deltaproteobacteria bacterium]|nr:hypothetical protein [Deltaproteobacteria bacterium]